MKKLQQTTTQWAGRICVAMVMALSVPAYAQTGGNSIEPQAEKLLRNMSNFLGKQQSFSVTTENSLEVVLKTGKKFNSLPPPVFCC